jgi:hypothetical protein
MNEATPATATTPTLVQHGLRWGVIVGIISIIMTVVLYAIDYTLMVQFKFLLVSLAVYIGFAIYAGIEYRKSVGGYLSYGKAWMHTMVIFAVSGLISTLFAALMYAVIDTELPAKLTDAAVENAREMMAGFGMQEGQQMDEAIDKARKDTADRFTPWGQTKGYFILLITSAILALITSIFVKKNEPVEM